MGYIKQTYNWILWDNLKQNLYLNKVELDHLVSYNINPDLVTKQQQQQILMYIQLHSLRKTVYSLLMNTFKHLLDLAYHQVEPYEITDSHLFFN